MTAPRGALAVRAYHALLWIVLPRHVRGRFMSDAVAVFSDVAAEARAQGAFAPWAALMAEVPGIIRFALARRAATPRDLYLPIVQEQSVSSSFIQDIRYAFRALRNSPVFTAVAVITLALGIGANAAIFSVVSGVLLKPLPVHEPDRLVALGEEPASNPSPTNYSSTSAYNFFAWAEGSRTMRMAAISGTPMMLARDGAEPERLSGTGVLGDFLGMIESRPAVGRFILPSDQYPEAERVVVLSDALWASHFGSDPAVIGTTITLNNFPRRVVGIMPPEFRFPDGAADFWLPLRLNAEDRANHDQYYLQPIGRLRPGATIEQARAEMRVVASRLKQEWPVFNGNLAISIYPVIETTVSAVRTQLLVLMAAVALVLVIACANLGNLLMARAAARRRELAVRQALGAGRRRIAQQLLTESMLLSLLGAGLGLAVGAMFLKLILAAQVTLNLPRVTDISLDWRVAGFTLGIGVAAGIFFGTFPIWELGRTHFQELRSGARGLTAASGMRDVLVVSQVALAMVLLTGAGLLVKSFERLQRVDPGFSADQVLTFSANGDSLFFRRAVERLRAVPGVRSVAMINQLPVTGRGGGAWFNRMDRPWPAGTTPPGEIYRVVSPEIFSTLGIRIQRGRALEAGDDRAHPVVVINAALAKKHYPGEDPIGKRIYLGAPDNRVIDNAEIVGVSDDTRDAGMASDPLPIVYVSWNAVHAGAPAFTIRAEQNAAALVPAVRAAIREIDPRAAVRQVRTMDEIVAESFAPARWSTTLVGVFALIALIISLVGIFGVLSFIVAQRTRELGIRLALGASTAGVRRLVVGRALVLAGLGLTLGTVGALYLTSAMTSLLFEVEPTDPATLVVVGGLLLGMAVVASYIPARRATRIDPLVALRSD